MIEKPHLCDAAASKRGAEANSCIARRFFTTHARPATFPCHFPFEPDAGVGAAASAPKIVVLVADPRHAVTLLWESLKRYCSCHGEAFLKAFPLRDFVEWVAGSHRFFGEFFEHPVEWAEESAKRPASVQLFDAGKLGSLDPNEVRLELEKIADFLEIPGEDVTALVAAAFRRPDHANEGAFSLPLCGCSLSKDSLFRGHLLEHTAGENLHNFEAAMGSASYGADNVRELWRDALRLWIASSSPTLAELALTSMKGIASTPPFRLTFPMKGESVHAAGACCPCVFALRGICRNTEEMCTYCHVSSHQKTKRARLRDRQAKRVAQSKMRTPSPSPAPRTAVGAREGRGALRIALEDLIR